MRQFLSMSITAAVLCVTLNEATGDFAIVEDGRPRATIVIAKEPIDSVKFAAEELRHYVERMSGATLSIADDTTEEKGPTILIGASKLTDALQLNTPSGFSKALNHEGYVLKTFGNRVLALVGNDGGPTCKEAGCAGPVRGALFERGYAGSLFSTYDLLERLGCRWFMPGEIGEVVPREKTLRIRELDVLEKPKCPIRGFWGYVGAPRDKSEATIKDLRDLAVWRYRVRLLPYGSVLQSAGDGSIMIPFR